MSSGASSVSASQMEIDKLDWLKTEFNLLRSLVQ
jgi:hypothetical protein